MNDYITDAANLEQTAARALLDSLPQSTKDAIDAALAAGVNRGDLMRRVARQSGNRQSLVTLALEEYLRTKHGWTGPVAQVVACPKCNGGRGGWHKAEPITHQPCDLCRDTGEVSNSEAAEYLDAIGR